MKNDSKFISLLSDYGFKAAFADESDTLFLRKALQALIQSEQKIKKITFLSNEFIGLTKESRGGLYDLVCEDESGAIFIVEMQLSYYKHYIQRAKFYAFQKFNTLVEKGDYYFDNLTKIYCIGILAKRIYPNSEQYYHYATLKNQIGEDLDDQITHIIVEIDKFVKEESQIHSDLDKLIYLMKNIEDIPGISELPKFLTEDWIEQAMKKVDKSKMTPDQRMQFEMILAKNGSILQMEKEEREEREKELQKEREEREKKFQKEIAEREKKFKTELEKAKKEQEKELVKAKAEKEKELEKAKAEKEKELAEKEAKVLAKAKKEKIEIALKLQSSGMSNSKIAEITGMPIDEIEKL